MESIILNVFTIGISSCILPVLLRTLRKRSLSKIAAVVVLLVNSILMAILWVCLRNLILTGDYNGYSPGGRYITYGVGIGTFISWGILTAMSQKPNQNKAENS